MGYDCFNVCFKTPWGLDTLDWGDGEGWSILSSSTCDSHLYVEEGCFCFKALTKLFYLYVKFECKIKLSVSTSKNIIANKTKS